MEIVAAARACKKDSVMLPAQAMCAISDTVNDHITPELKHIDAEDLIDIGGSLCIMLDFMPANEQIKFLSNMLTALNEAYSRGHGDKWPVKFAVNSDLLPK
jgi:hypothetical protein